MRFLKKLLISLYVYLAVFAVVCLVLWVVRGDEPHTLITAVFSAAGVESIIGGIMKVKEKKTESAEADSAEKEEPPRRAE
jgi:uncharacterized membrane protein YeiB